MTRTVITAVFLLLISCKGGRHGRYPGHPLILKENGIPGKPLFSYILQTRPPGTTFID